MGVEEGRNVPMFDTNIKLKGAGPFQGNMVVSMRPYRPDQIDAVKELTGAFPGAHGSPVQVGDPTDIGIRDCGTPQYGDPVTVNDGEVPLFGPAVLHLRMLCNELACLLQLHTRPGIC